MTVPDRLAGSTGRPRVTVIGLGPAGVDLLTSGTCEAIGTIRPQFVRTRRHPSARALVDATSFDELYERAATIDEVYTAIVEALVEAAQENGEVLYAVPGSPAVAERTVELLLGDDRVLTEVLPALSCLDLAWIRLGVDPLAEGVRVVDGHRFALTAAGERGPLLVLQCDSPQVLAAIKLATDPGQEPETVTVLHRLGLPDEHLEELGWDELDRVRPDHLTSLWIPTFAPAVGRELVRFAELVRTLREQCDWDAEQTHASLRRYVIEEAYEVAEAIDRMDEHGSEALEEELGDLLFQVYFHSVLAAEDGQFTLADVARGIHDKLVRRHPHVFGGEARDWETIKGEENKAEANLDALPALLGAEKAQRRAARAGFDWPDVSGAWPKVLEEIDEARAAGPAEIEEEIGDLLFACVNVARHLGVDPEAALHRARHKFTARFDAVLRLADERGSDRDLATLDALWDEVKLAGQA
jgi:tetrapyrrole methylase family protein/MazG family protein